MTRADTKKGDLAVILALARGDSVAKAAEAGKVSKSTVLRRLQRPEFRDQVRDARAAMVDEALGRLSQAASFAVVTLMELLRSTSPMAKLGAARTILEMLKAYRETEEFEQRLTAIEEQLAKGEQEQWTDGAAWPGSRTA